MNQNEPTDHWASLAAELGAQPASESPADKLVQQASSPDASVPPQSDVVSPAVAAGGDSDQQAVSAALVASADSPGASLSRLESSSGAAGTDFVPPPEPSAAPTTGSVQTELAAPSIPAEKTAPSIPAEGTAPPTQTTPTTPSTQTKSSWDILAEQLGIASELGAEVRQTEVAGGAGHSCSAERPEGASVLAIGQGAAQRPAGGVRSRRQPTPTRFGEGIFDDGPSADAVHSTDTAGETAREPWRPAGLPPAELPTAELPSAEIPSAESPSAETPAAALPTSEPTTPELPTAEARAAASEVADLTAGQIAAQESAESVSAQRPAERKSRWHRRKQRRSRADASTTEPQPDFDAPAVESVSQKSEASHAEPEQGQDWPGEVEPHAQWHEPASAQHHAARQAEQTAAAVEASSAESTQGYSLPSVQDDFVHSSHSAEATEQRQAAVDQSAAAGSQAADSAASARGELAKHRAIPTWAEAISVIINANLEARARRGDAGRERRDRGGR